MKADARYAVLAMLAEEMLGSPLVLSPPADPRLAAIGYTIVGYVTAVDQVLSLGRQRVYYGFLAAGGATPPVLAIRGTERAIEWAKDAEGVKLAHPIAGCVHAGFWNIYDSARLLMPSGAEQPLVAGVAALQPKGVVVTGHSLGAPIATYAAFDLATLGPVSARLFASPRPGDVAFSAAASAAVPDHVSYAYEPDLVPRVPFGFGYCALQNVIVLPLDAAIPNNPESWHHARNYAWLLDPSVVPGPL